MTLIYSWTPAIIYSVLLIHPQPLSISLFLSHTFYLFPSIFHLSSAPATPHLCPPSPTPTLFLCFYYILLLSVVFLCSVDIFLVSSLFLFFSLNPLPPSPRPAITSLFLSTPLLASTFSSLRSSLSLLFLPSITCVHAVRGRGVLILRYAGRHSDGRLGAHARVFVCMVGCLRNTTGNNSPDHAVGRRACRQAGRVRSAAPCSTTRQATFESSFQITVYLFPGELFLTSTPRENTNNKTAG